MVSCKLHVTYLQIFAIYFPRYSETLKSVKKNRNGAFRVKVVHTAATNASQKAQLFTLRKTFSISSFTTSQHLFADKSVSFVQIMGNCGNLFANKGALNTPSGLYVSIHSLVCQRTHFCQATRLPEHH